MVHPTAQQEDSKKSDTLAISENTAARSRNWSLLALVIALNLATFMSALDNTVVATAIPTITSQFHSIGDVGWYGSVYMLSMTPLQPTLGKVYKMFNIKYVYISALIIFEVGSILGASAPSSSVLIVGRAVAGTGATAIFAGGMAIINDSIPKERRSLHISFFQSMFGSANMVGPLLGGVLTDILSWRWCFWINVPLGVLISLVVFFCYSEHRDQQKMQLSVREKIRQIDIMGSILLIASIICLLLALHWGGTTFSWKSIRIICLLVSSAVLICGFGILQYMQPHSALIPFQLISKRVVWTNALYMFFLTIGRFTHVYYLPFYFQTCKGASAIGSGLHFLPYSIPATVSTIVLGVFINATGFYAPVQLIGAMLFTIGSGLISSLKLSTSAGQWIGYQVLVGVGAGAGVQTPYLAVQDIIEPSDVHTANAIIMFMTGLGGALSVSVAQNIFTTVLLRGFPDYSNADSGFNSTEPLNLGLRSSGEAIPSDQLQSALNAFAHALDKTFIVPIVAGSLCVLLAVTAVHRKQEKGTAEKTDV